MSNYTFDGSEGQFIPESTAKQYVENYQNSPVMTLNQGVKAHFFGKDILIEMLNQEGAKGLRMYYGSKSASNLSLVPEIVVVAANADGDDILANQKIADFSRPCPEFCPDVGLVP